MTSFAFILGVVPLVLATGAGASARASIGITVFTGMIASTCLAVLFVPSFFVVVQRFEEWRAAPQDAHLGERAGGIAGRRGCDAPGALLTLLTKHQCGGFEHRDRDRQSQFGRRDSYGIQGFQPHARHPWHVSRLV